MTARLGQSPGQMGLASLRQTRDEEGVFLEASSNVLAEQPQA